jgi:hypothetical protein
MLKFDSNEEEWFSWYLEELQEHKLISNWNYNTKEIELTKERTFLYNNKEYHLLRNMVYTYDFDITWTDKGIQRLCAVYGEIRKIKYKLLPFKVYGNVSYVEVKGVYTRTNRVTDITFPIKQKIMYDLKGIYVQKIVPVKLMELTFYPTKYQKEMEYKAKIGSRIKTPIVGIDEWLKLGL